MAVAGHQFGYLVNVGLGAFLLLLAALVVRRMAIPGRRWLALFLFLVGLNYLLDGVGRVFTLQNIVGLSLLPTILDPAALMLFALSLRREDVPRWVQAAVVLPPLFLVGYSVASWPDPIPAPLIVGVFVPYYVIALALAGHAHHASRSATEQGVLARIFVALAIITLTRLPLVFVDLQIIGHARRHFLFTLAYFDLPLAALAIATGLIFYLTASTHARPTARRAITQGALLLAIVDAIWLMRFMPGLAVGGSALLYSCRWLVFAGLITYDLRRYELLGVPSRVGSIARASFALLLVFVVYVEFVSLLSGGAYISASTLAISAIATTPVAIGAAIYVGRRADPVDARRLRIYRAHAELGASEGDLARLREELGITFAEAREEDRLLALEARAPPLGLGRPAVGAVFARRYEVATLIGAGAFGLVYDAFDRIDGRRVVLKELRPDWRAAPESIAQLRREAEVALRVNSPHVVRLLSIERAADGHVLVLEHVEGETLRARLARGPLTSAQASKLAADVLDALTSLHSAGILHRDVKPENIVIRPSGAAVLIDLGAAAATTDSGTRPAGGPHVGTPAYMSPEQRRGAALTSVSDLYALGVVLWEALALELPQKGDVPDAWREVLLRALAVEPRGRFADAAGFRAALPGTDQSGRHSFKPTL